MDCSNDYIKQTATKENTHLNKNITNILVKTQQNINFHITYAIKIEIMPCCWLYCKFVLSIKQSVYMKWVYCVSQLGLCGADVVRLGSAELCAQEEVCHLRRHPLRAPTHLLSREKWTEIKSLALIVVNIYTTACFPPRLSVPVHANFGLFLF